MSESNQNLIVGIKEIISRYEDKAKVLFNCIEQQSAESKLKLSDHDFYEKNVITTVERTILIIKRRIYTEISLELSCLRAHDDND